MRDRSPVTPKITILHGPAIDVYKRQLPYIAPHFIIFAVFGIIPIIFGIGLAFTRWNMVGSPQFVGLQNFAKIFDPSTYFYSIFWRDLWHTLIFVLISEMCIRDSV